MPSASADTIAAARHLRRTMSLPEVLLWTELQRRPGGFRFRRQHPIGRYVLDFACLSARLAIEIDGVAHDGIKAQRRDAIRDAWLEARGFRTLRVIAADVLADIGAVVDAIVTVAAARPLHQPWAGPTPRAGEDWK